ncbi:MAG: hypothetical protein L6R41_005937 [Letrouitia leprolyta]|nr:MAG: hypothetical protein L6R41_005937 [Letrouitia leprolyta]
MNLEITLVKVQVPREFNGLGSMISPKRKESAESGSFDRTARKLGALFEGSLPSIPELVKEYGTRVSEIAQSEKIKTKDPRSEELSSSLAGPDSPSLWAAVTSGEAAVNSRKVEVNMVSVIALKQDFGRNELAKLDNSARSWIQCEDLVMKKQHLNMLNMFDAANISVNSEGNTYTSVMTAWADVLNAMNCLVFGVAQRV